MKIDFIEIVCFQHGLYSVDTIFLPGTQMEKRFPNSLAISLCSVKNIF